MLPLYAYAYFGTLWGQSLPPITSRHYRITLLYSDDIGGLPAGTKVASTPTKKKIGPLEGAFEQVLLILTSLLILLPKIHQCNFQF
jgi:hypothetical protein